MHPKRLTLLLAAALLTAAITASAAAAYSRYYVDELYVDRALEKAGIPYKSYHINVDNASCTGLRRYGVQAEGDYGNERFWRFRCDVVGANNHMYDVQLSTTTGPNPRWVYRHYLSVRRTF